MTAIGLLGCGGNAGINFVKSIKLGDPNLHVVGFDTDSYNLIASNCDSKILLPQKITILEKLKLINTEIGLHEIEAMHAQPDKEVEFLCRYKDQIQCKTFDHNLNEWNLYANKLLCAKIWSDKLKLDFTSYKLTEVIQQPQLWNKLTRNQAKVWFRSIQGAGSKAALPVTSLTEAQNWALYWINNRNCFIEEFMMSELLPGPEYAVQTFWINGNLVHAQARERLVYFFGNIMPSGQSSTPSVASTVQNPDVYDIAQRSILSLSDSPHGIYCVDLKTNRNNQIIPTEINYGRFFTTSDFFARLGVNTPYVYLKNILDNTNNPQDLKINFVNDKHYWVRGIDKEPKLFTQQEMDLLCRK